MFSKLNVFLKQKLASPRVLWFLLFVAFLWGCFLTFKLQLLEFAYLDTAEVRGEYFATKCFQSQRADIKEKWRELLPTPIVKAEHHWLIDWLLDWQMSNHLRAQYNQRALAAFEKRLERLEKAAAQKETPPPEKTDSNSVQ